MLLLGLIAPGLSEDRRQNAVALIRQFWVTLRDSVSAPNPRPVVSFTAEFRLPIQRAAGSRPVLKLHPEGWLNCLLTPKGDILRI